MNLSLTQLRSVGLRLILLLRAPAIPCVLGSLLSPFLSFRGIPLLRPRGFIVFLPFCALLLRAPPSSLWPRLIDSPFLAFRESHSVLQFLFLYLPNLRVSWWESSSCLVIPKINSRLRRVPTFCLSERYRLGDGTIFHSPDCRAHYRMSFLHTAPHILGSADHWVYFALPHF